MAAGFGLNVDQFTTDLDNGVFSQKVALSGQEAASIGLPGTPALLVNGEIVGGQGLPPYEVWEEYVEGIVLVNSMPQYAAAPPMTLNPNANYLATVNMANGGKIVMELYADKTPITVNSFVFLANEGFFDGVTFHRVMAGFVAQTGDPTGTGRGGPGYEFVNEVVPELGHDSAGMVAMANSGPDTNGSQWYITLAPTSQLNGSYTVFGKVIEGLEEVVFNISPRDPSDANAPDGDMIESITIEVLE